MNLLLLLSSLDRGGAETHVLALATSLTRRGHSVTVLSSGGSLVEDLLQANVEHRTLPLHSRSPLALLRSHWGLKKILSERRYDLIHAHSRIPAFLVSATARRRKIPMITTVHASFRVNALLRHFSRWGDYSIAVSEDLRQYLSEKYRCSSERIEVIPNGIDTSHFCPAPEATLFAPHRLLYLSRLDEDCSEVAFLLCRLAETLKKRYPDFELVLGGGGSAMPRLRILAEKINARASSPFVFLTGHLWDVRAEYWRAHTVIGVSRVALEAMACGIPVILAGNEGFGGFLLPSNLEEAKASNFCCRDKEKVTELSLYHAIISSFSMSWEERISLGKELSQGIQSFFDIEKVTQKTLAVYQKLCREQQMRGGELVLCGYYGYGNTGDHALLRAAVERIRKETPNLSFCALTAHGKKDEPLFGIRCLPRNRPLLLLRTIRHAKKLVFGGGTLLQDRTSLRSLCYYVFLLRYAQRHGVSTELWANGLTPPRSRLARALTSCALRNVQRLGVRDQTSLSLAKELSRKKNGILLENDLAENTSSSEETRISFLQSRYRLRQKDGSLRPYVVIAPRGREKRGQVRIFSWWLGRLRKKTLFPIFVPLFPKEDEFLCQRLAYEFGGCVAHGLSESDLVGLMKQSDCVASMRLHGLIFARSAGVPFVGFGEDPKIETYCHEHGGHYWTSTLDEK